MTEQNKREVPFLKPCPFCGSKMSITYNSLGKEYNFWHEGTNEKCTAREPFFSMTGGTIIESIADAVRVWNSIV